MRAPVAITIGNFDGVHRGHQALIAAARAAVGPDGRVVALSFDPLPATWFRGDDAPKRLGTADQRSEALQAAGADAVEFLNPADGVLSWTPEAFVAELSRRFAPRAIVEGPDFRFGAGRAGSLETLRALAADAGFEVIEVPAVEAALAGQQSVRVSSSRIRSLLAAGRVDDAARLLGRPWTLRGVVRPGAQRGRTIGVPTANVDAPGLMTPADGVYSGEACDGDGIWHRAAISVARNPTFGETERRVEVHLVDYAGPIGAYDWTCDVRFHRWIRDVIPFPSIDALTAQLRRDIDQARRAPTPSDLNLHAAAPSIVPVPSSEQSHA